MGAVRLETMTVYDIVIVYGEGAPEIEPKGQIAIAEHYGANIIRGNMGEWPCPLSLRDEQRVIYLQKTPEFEWVGRIIKEGYTPTVIHIDNLPEGLLP